MAMMVAGCSAGAVVGVRKSPVSERGVGLRAVRAPAGLGGARRRVAQAKIGALLLSVDGVLALEGAVRPGVLSGVDSALGAGLQVLVGRAAGDAAVEDLEAWLGPRRVKDGVKIVEAAALGDEGGGWLAGAAESVGVRGVDCIAIQSTSEGCAAAVAAGMKVIVTHTPATRDGDFAGAEVVLENLGSNVPQEGDPRIVEARVDSAARSTVMRFILASLMEDSVAEGEKDGPIYIEKMEGGLGAMEK